ncbi:MAG: DUF1501 domain-containing protein [Rhodocyclaceae bacterium]
MDRRDFLRGLAASAGLTLLPFPARAAGEYGRLLVLVELKGGNDGLNTVVPYADDRYYRLRPHLAVRRDEVLRLDERCGLHPALQPLLPLWQAGELALIQGLGYPEPNLSHFRSIEIWDTASKSSEYLQTGWLARAFAAKPVPAGFAADGVLVGGTDLGPFFGGARAIALTNPEQFRRLAILARPVGTGGHGALAHILKVEADIALAASRLARGPALRTAFPKGAFGNTVKTACEALAGGAGVAALRLSLAGFDTHQNQPGAHANLLRQLAEGLGALKAALVELGRWDETLILTYAEFGRRPRENQSKGTDHGTANVHFALGGRVRGGLFGAPPALDRLDGNGNLPFAVDFRSLYATALERWWGISAATVLGARYDALPILKA